MRTVCVENRSAQVSPPQLAAIGAALGLQLARDFNTSPWVEHGYVAPAHLVVAATSPPAGVFDRLVLVDERGEAGEMGFHTTQEGVAVGEVLVPAILASGSSVCEVAGHELYELLVDPDDQKPWLVKHEGFIYPVEVCDAVESCGYELLGEIVPDICWPRYFGLGQTRAALSQREALSGSPSVAGVFELAALGYISRAPEAEPGNWSEVFGQARTALPPWAHRLARIASAASSTVR